MLDRKIAIVTGAGQGLGRGIACEMARQRAAGIAVVDRNRHTAEETAALVKNLGSEVLVIECNLRDRDQIQAAVDSAAAHFGGLDVLVNNAGIVETTMTADCAVDTLPEDVWDAVYEVNLRAPWLATKFAAPYLRRSDRGPNIVNACSVGGLVAFPRAPAYCATKGGAASHSSPGLQRSTSARRSGAMPTRRARSTPQWPASTSSTRPIRRRPNGSSPLPRSTAAWARRRKSGNWSASWPPTTRRS